MDLNIKLAGLTRESTVDGPGIRMAIYFQGCPHHCRGCHNPETWDPEDGVEKTVTETLELINRLITPLHSGLTISGGEPFFQQEGLLALVKGVKEQFPHLNIWCYTGYHYEDLAGSPVLPYLDVLVDGPFEEEQRELDLVYKGSRNQRIIDIPASQSKGEVVEDPRYLKH